MSSRSEFEEFARDCVRLAVNPQEVIPGQTESANRRFACEANMRPVPVVAMEPSGQRGVSFTPPGRAASRVSRRSSKTPAGDRIPRVRLSVVDE
jgi:hypothetical protein